MRYIFETGFYPNETIVDDKELDTDEIAIAHAKEIKADYVWDAPSYRNPTTIYVRNLNLEK